MSLSHAAQPGARFRHAIASLCHRSRHAHEAMRKARKDFKLDSNARTLQFAPERLARINDQIGWPVILGFDRDRGVVFSV